ncbi:Cl- channel, voltage-gated family protein [mine drainage metagenome]|uniref:Cl-channel, voltage-gated family protein n=1 Tax=mine drainage metagenome TaxID=410659 RepID=T1BWJ6_9ZZZZ
MTSAGTDPQPPAPEDPPASKGWKAWAHSFTDTRALYRWALIGITVGVIAGFVALAFYYALQLASDSMLGGLLGINLPTNGSAPGASFSWSTDPSTFFILPLLLIAGGLAVGLLVTNLAPETGGHGTDQAIRAFHRGRGAVRARVPPIKFLVSVLTLGTGGSGGREGPTAQIGSGLATFLAHPLGLTTRERRIAMMVGVGAGIGAIFKAPFGAALLSAEILYLSDFEPDVIMPSILGSVISYSIFGSVEGFGPEFATPAGLGWSPDQLPLYAILGVVCGLLGILYVVTFHRTHRAFDRVNAPTWARPAIGVAIVGALFVGLYYLVPQESHLLAVGGIGIGYGIVQWLLFQGSLPILVLVLLVGLIFVKIVATSLTVGSGGSAGLFGPGIVIGALIGFSVSGFTDQLVPSFAVTGDSAAFAIIGMMAFFGSVSRAPVAVILMVVEMTGSESLIVPAMIAIFIAYYVNARHNLYTEQVENRLASPAHTTEYFAEFLKHVPSSAAMRTDVPCAAPTASVEEAHRALGRSDVSVVAVIDHDRLVGEVRLADVLDVPLRERALETVQRIARENYPVVHPASTLLDTLGRMDAENADAILVVDPDDPHHLLGVVTRESITNFQRSPRA